MTPLPTSMLSEKRNMERGSPLVALLGLPTSTKSRRERKERWEDSTVAWGKRGKEERLQHSWPQHIHVEEIIENTRLNLAKRHTYCSVLLTGHPSTSLSTSNMCICPSVFLLSSLMWLHVHIHSSKSILDGHLAWDYVHLVTKSMPENVSQN